MIFYDACDLTNKLPALFKNHLFIDGIFGFLKSQTFSQGFIDQDAIWCTRDQIAIVRNYSFLIWVDISGDVNKFILFSKISTCYDLHPVRREKILVGHYKKSTDVSIFVF